MSPAIVANDDQEWETQLLVNVRVLVLKVDLQAWWQAPAAVLYHRRPGA